MILNTFVYDLSLETKILQKTLFFKCTFFNKKKKKTSFDFRENAKHKYDKFDFINFIKDFVGIRTNFCNIHPNINLLTFCSISSFYRILLFFQTMKSLNTYN